MHEYAWKTVFLHSLVGRSEGLESNIFGLTESEALFSTSFPGLTPPQVLTALKEIANSAFYLRYEQGKYFASEEPTINSVLARIRRSVSTDEVREVLDQTARKVVSPKGAPFHVEHDVSAPEHIPDNTGKPVLGVVSLNAESIDVEAMITTAGMNRPRVHRTGDPVGAGNGVGKRRRRTGSNAHGVSDPSARGKAATGGSSPAGTGPAAACREPAALRRQSGTP